MGLHGQCVTPGAFFDYRLPVDDVRQRLTQGDCKEEDAPLGSDRRCAGGVWRPKPGRLAGQAPVQISSNKRQLASDDEAWEPGYKDQHDSNKLGGIAEPGVRVPTRLRVEGSLDRELSLARSASIKSGQSGQTDLGGAGDESSAWRVSTPGQRDSRKGLGRLLIQRIIHAVAEEEQDVEIGGGTKGADLKLGQAGIKTSRSKGVEKAEAEGVERTAGVTSPVGEVSRNPGTRAAPPPPLARLAKQSSLDDREWGPVPVDYGPRTPSLLDTVKCTMDSPGHSSSHALAFAQASATNLPLRKRLTRKGVPARGDSGLMDARGVSNESGGEGVYYGRESSPPRENHPLSRPRVYPCSPDVSFESLERARLQDEEEGVVDSVQVPRSAAITSIGGHAGRTPGMLGARASKACTPPPVYPGNLKDSLASPKTSPQPPEVYSHSVSGDERDFAAEVVTEFGSFKRPRSKRLPTMVSAKRPRFPRVASYFPDDVSLEPPSPSHSLGSSGSEGCSGVPLAHPWPKAAHAGSSRPHLLSHSSTGLGAGVKRVVGGARKEGWVPPVSPYGLILEKLYSAPWKLLLACMLLDKTSDKQVRAYVDGVSRVSKPFGANLGLCHFICSTA